MTKDFTRAEPAEGSRDVIERELARREVRNAKSKQRQGSARRGAEAPLRSEDVATELRDADDHLIAEIIATGASLRDFTEALAWINDDDAVLEAGGAPPSGRAGEIVRLLRQADDMRVGGATDEP
jgi:hypothetical protein